jgi:hypothetical protein
VQISSHSENEYAPKSSELELPPDITPGDAKSHSSELLFADIVKHDILRFLDKKQKSLQRPSWSWNHN